MLTHTSGFPRIGRNRELKKAVEAYWKGAESREGLEATCRKLRKEHWEIQQRAGVDILPVGDFSMYDHMLDTAALVGCVPARFGFDSGNVDTETYFRMARGDARPGSRVPAMEMTKWFDTNYHYIVPEFEPEQKFRIASTKLFDELDEAVALGIRAKAVLPGPFTFLQLGKMVGEGGKWSLLDKLLPVYEEILARIGTKCEWVQLDEPILVTDVPEPVRTLFKDVYRRLIEAAGPAKVMVATYFGTMEDQFDLIAGLPLDGLHLDLVRAPEQLEGALTNLPEGCSLSMGLINGRNVWRTDLESAAGLVKIAAQKLGAERVMIAPSCSLLHSPVDLASEKALDPEIRSWMAFAVQKCEELRSLADSAAGKGEDDVFRLNTAAVESRRTSTAVHDPAVQSRLASVGPDMSRRASPYGERIKVQRAKLKLPVLPVTTIGSFPQTAELRQARRKYKIGEMGREEYEANIKDYIKDCIERQEAAGADVLVHGEPERNDMVEYFGERMKGFCFTSNGWVQSYGSRCVKPPVIFGDVSRPSSMTIRWTEYAMGLTERPMKGMLTGPVTILCWSFVRDDQPRETTCRQLALAVRDEVADLEKIGTPVIQVDEPALREGLPLRRADRDEYLNWAVECFRIAVSGAADHTQIHTHMCYAEFNEIIESIAAMDADVISIEASRSGMELLKAFGTFNYPNEVGPGVWDIHSPRVPSVEEMTGLLNKALEVVPKERLWVNPDCGLKTRAWEETEASLRNLVAAARALR